MEMTLQSAFIDTRRHLCCAVLTACEESRRPGFNLKHMLTLSPVQGHSPHNIWYREGEGGRGPGENRTTVIDHESILTRPLKSPDKRFRPRLSGSIVPSTVRVFHNEKGKHTTLLCTAACFSFHCIAPFTEPK